MNLIVSLTSPRLRKLVSRSRLRSRPELNANDLWPNQRPSIKINHQVLIYSWYLMRWKRDGTDQPYTILTVSLRDSKNKRGRDWGCFKTRDFKRCRDWDSFRLRNLEDDETETSWDWAKVVDTKTLVITDLDLRITTLVSFWPNYSGNFFWSQIWIFVDFIFWFSPNIGYFGLTLSVTLL